MIVHQLMCPNCTFINRITEEPSENIMYPCGRCDTSFKIISVRGVKMTANAGDDPEEAAKKFEGIPQDIFDAINVGRNPGKLIFESTPGSADNVASVFRRLFTAPTNWRDALPEAVLLSCPCPECREELAKRARNGCMGPTVADCKERFSDGSEAFGGAPVHVPSKRDLSDCGCETCMDTLAKRIAKENEDRVPSVPEIMAEAAETFKQRNALYGDSYKHFHEVMLVLFPDGMHLKTADDWRRFGILFYAIGKLVRYCNNFGDGGHIDSAHDLGVYSFMLEEVSRIGLKEKGL